MVPSFLNRLFRRRRISTVDELAAFMQAEATYVVQVSLFGYLRARMGTQWPAYFEDEAFAPAIKASQEAGFRLCLGNLVAFVATELDVRDNHHVLLGALGQDASLVANVDWMAPTGTAFQNSLAGLIDLAPVSLDYQAEDREAFTNALELRWAEVRRRFEKRIDRESVKAEINKTAR